VARRALRSADAIDISRHAHFTARNEAAGSQGGTVPRRNRGYFIGRREEQPERRRVHIAELNRRATESELCLKRLYDVIAAGVANLADPELNNRIANLTVIREQSRADADHAQAMPESIVAPAITPKNGRPTIGRTTHARPMRRVRRLQRLHHGIEEQPAQDAGRRRSREIDGGRRARPGTEVAEQSV
jgi:hypothetical protein